MICGWLCTPEKRSASRSRSVTLGRSVGGGAGLPMRRGSMHAETSAAASMRGLRLAMPKRVRSVAATEV